MTNEDSQIFRAIAEVALTGFTDEYGNRMDLASRVVNGWKPSEEFYKKLEKKISLEVLAEKFADNLTRLSRYDSDKIRDGIIARAKEIAAEKIAEKMIKDM